MNFMKRLEGNLFPPSCTYALGWTTADYVNLENVIRVPLSDSSLGVHKVVSGTTHSVVTSPRPINDQDKSWKAIYPKGSINPGGKIRGGFGFYLSGPADFREPLRAAQEAVFSYSVMFEEGWEWVKGGKLPGAFGGIASSAYGCTGGRQEDRCKCFDLRLMWRINGAGELYLYMPDSEQNSKRLSEVPPYSEGNPKYGFSVGRGSFTFPSGEWTVIAERVRLNDVGKENGAIQLWVNGESVIEVEGLSFRDTDSSQMQGFHFETFFGGHTSDWASPKDQKTWFSDVSCAIIAPSSVV